MAPTVSAKNKAHPRCKAAHTDNSRCIQKGYGVRTASKNDHPANLNTSHRDPAETISVSRAERNGAERLEHLHSLLLRKPHRRPVNVARRSLVVT